MSSVAVRREGEYIDPVSNLSMEPNVQDPTFSSSLDQLTLSDRMTRVFHAPLSSFRAVQQEQSWQDWLLPAVLMCIVWVATNYLTLSVVGNPELPALQPRLETLTEEQRVQALESLGMWRQHGWFTMPIVSTFSSLAALGLVLLALGRYAFRADVALRGMLVVKAYAMLVLIPEWIVRTPLILIQQTPDIKFGPGALLSEDIAATFVGRILAGIDFFDVWQGWIMGVGLAVMAGIPTRHGIIAVLALWGAWVVVGALLWALPAAGV